MGATTSAALPDDAAEVDAVLRTFIAENLERAEWLLRRAEEQLGGLFQGVAGCGGGVVW